MIHMPNVREVLLVSLLIGLVAAEQNHKTWMDYGGGYRQFLTLDFKKRQEMINKH